MAKNEYGYMAKIGGDTSGLQLSLQEAQAAVKEAESGLKTLDKTISEVAKNGGDTSELLEAREKAYASYAATIRDQLQQLSSISGEVEKAFEEGRIEAGEYATYMSQLAQAAERAKKAQEETNPAFFANSFSELNSVLEKANKEYSDTSERLDKVNNALKQTGDSEELFKQKTELLGEVIKETETKLTALERMQVRMKESLNNGVISADEYEKFNNEIGITSDLLKSLRAELDETKNAQNALAQTTSETTEESIKFGDIIKANVISDLTVKGIEKTTAAIKELGEELKAIVIDTAAYGDTVDKQSQRLGMTRDAYQEWNYILSQNGANISTLTAGMRTLTNQIDSAANGGKAASAAFEKLGLSADNLKELTGEQQFSAVVTALQGMADETDRNAIANDVLGRSYQQLIPLLNQDSDSVERLRQRAHDTNQILSGEGVTAAVNYTDAMDTLTKSIDGFKHQLGEQVLPVVTEFIDEVIEAINDTDEEQVKNMLKKIADGAKELADVIRDFINEGGIEKIIDFFDRIIDHADDIVSALKLLAGAWGISKIAEFCGQLGKIPGLITKVTNSIAGLPGQISSVGTAFGNIGTAATNGMNTVVSAVTGAQSTVTVSLGAIAAAAAAAAAAIASAIAIADELNTISDAMTYESAEAKESKKNVDEMTKQWEDLENMQGLDRYNAAVDYKENILEREEEWNKRYKNVIDELGELQEKKFKTTSETARQKELESTKETLDAEWAMIEVFNAKVDNELSNYTSESVGRLQEAGAAQKQAIANAGRTNEEAVGEVWDKIRETAKNKMDELDSQLAKHQITENDYWSQRKEYLESHRDEESEEWWKYYDSVTEHYEKAAETERKAAEKAASDAKKTTENSVKSSIENLKRLQKEQGLDDKWLEEQYLLLAESQKKGTDAYYLAYDAYLDIREKNRKEEQKQADEDAKQRKKEAEDRLEDEKKAAEDRLKELKKQHEEEVKAKKKEAEDNLSLLRKTREDYTKTAAEMSEKVTSNGKERLVLGDNKEEAKKLRKYRESMEKLKVLGLSEELLASVYDFSYEDGSRQMYINELLGMSAKNRQKYDKEYQEYVAEQKKTAEYDTGLKFEEQEKSLYDAANGVLEEPAEQAYQWGVTAGENYIKGLETVIGNYDGIADVFTMNTAGKSSAGSKNSGETAANFPGNQGSSGNGGLQGISPETPIIVNVAGEEVIRSTLGSIMMNQFLSGGG